MKDFAFLGAGVLVLVVADRHTGGMFLFGNFPEDIHLSGVLKKISQTNEEERCWQSWRLTPPAIPSTNHNPISIAGDWFKNGHVTNPSQCELRGSLLAFKHQIKRH